MTNKMTTTTNNKNKFFREQLRKNFSFPFNLSIIILLVAVLLLISFPKEKKFDVATIKLNQGWGYVITNNNRIIIKQTIIPVISENKSFQTEKEAMAVGQLVMKKLETNLSPTITKKDLILLKIRL